MHRFGFVSLLLALAVVSLFLGLPLSIAHAEGEVQLTKVASSDNASLGDTITYTYIVTSNSSDNLTGLQLMDDKIGEVAIPEQLAPGDNITATASYVVSEADYSDNKTQVVNIATLYTSSENVTATATVDLNPFDIPVEEDVQLTKLASLVSASVGDNITYTYTITNNSSDNLTGFHLADDKIGDIALPDGLVLVPGDNITTTASYIVSEADYSDNVTQLINIATLTNSENITEATATAAVDLIPEYVASLQVTKEADPTVALLGDVITYTYNVSNNGDVEINNLLLNDNKLDNIPLISDNVTVTSLLPGENITAVATYTVALGDLLAGSIENTATAMGQDPNGNTVTASSPEVTVSTNIIKVLLTKAEILKLSGVPGKGIDTAPGLQKPFNPNSQASEHAGKKDGKGNLERNQEQEMNGNIEQNQSQEFNSGSYQNQELNQEQEINSDNGTQKNQKQEKNNNKGKNKDEDKGKGKGLGKNK